MLQDSKCSLQNNRAAIATGEYHSQLLQGIDFFILGQRQKLDIEIQGQKNYLRP